MRSLTRRSFLATTAAATACSSLHGARADGKETFVCPPCGCSMDDVVFDAPGTCPDCGMVLMPGAESDLGADPTALPPRASAYTLRTRDAPPIRIHCYKPDRFTPDSPILLVVPGAGRNSAEYRNAWLTTARQHNVLVAALGYPEADYDFAAYHMGGVVRNLRFQNAQIERPNARARVIRLKDEDIDFEINPDRENWLFPDFDKVFDHLAALTGSERQGYDIFGHSAGGQILHRMAIFHPRTKAERIIAANAGFYTFPDLNRPPPSGLAGFGLGIADLEKAFAQPLTLLLGEEDDSERAGGTFLRTPMIDRQGQGRLQRGRSFHAFAQDTAREIGVPLRWALETVPGVGHAFAGMTRAAATLFY